MKIVLASRNKHKIAELQALLQAHIGGVEILSLDDVGFSDEIVEDGKDFFENATMMNALRTLFTKEAAASS